MEQTGCGTDIILHLKQPDADNGIEDYTDRWKLALIVHKHSDFIAYPIIYEGPAQERGEKEDPAKAIKIETKTLNSMKPIWTYNRSEVSESDYNDFYKHLSNDWTDPLKVLPLKAEGTFEYEALLFIPSQAPYDLFYQAGEAFDFTPAKKKQVGILKEYPIFTCKPCRRPVTMGDAHQLRCCNEQIIKLRAVIIRCPDVGCSWIARGQVRTNSAGQTTYRHLGKRATGCPPRDRAA